jgi:hypothetical protein
LFGIQRPQQRAASALPHRFCFAEKLPFLAIFGDFWQFLKQKICSRQEAFIGKQLFGLFAQKKKLQLEPILTKYGLISLSGHLEDAYMS